MLAPLLALLTPLATLTWAPLAAHPQDKGMVTIEVRVGSAERGWAMIDRGSTDHLLVGDVVLFQPRQGGTYQGKVVELEQRAARVQLVDPGFLPAPGTRGKVLVPRERLAQGEGRARLVPAPKREAPVERPDPVFENLDEEWQSGEPLLARVRAVRPEERARSVHGRFFASLDATEASEDDRSDAFARTGLSTVVENPFGRGDRLHADVEWNYRRVRVPDLDDEEDVELRLDRLSYTSGGTRFRQSGWEAGRFLQGGMSEFGVLDGVEWIARRPDGDRYGLSLGFMPEPDEEFQTGSDFQVAGFYRWVADETEQLSAALGYQKTFHDADADRDLLVASFQHLPRAGWTLFGTAWIDFYTEGDDQKGTLLGLTQLYASAGRSWESGSSLDLVYNHQEFPEIDRHEFLPVDDAQLADDHNERLALRSRLRLAEDTQLLTVIGGWIDEDEEGGDAELGIGLRDVLFERDYLDLAVFGTKGRYQGSLGGRSSLGCLTEGGRWALDYEFSQNRLDGFSSANDDLPQHRLRLSRDWYGWHGWDLSARVEAVLYDDENALMLGLYLQRTY